MRNWPKTGNRLCKQRIVERIAQNEKPRILLGTHGSKLKHTVRSLDGNRDPGVDHMGYLGLSFHAVRGVYASQIHRMRGMHHHFVVSFQQTKASSDDKGWKHEVFHTKDGA